MVNVEKKEGKKETETEVQKSFATTEKRKEERNLYHKDRYTYIKLLVKNERKTETCLGKDGNTKIEELFLKNKE